ncbi:c-type cytochrome [Pseudocolwellia sp. HL-MZ7]|uniref:c-type cytochrome n=1 Tax=Pseudocolwellia sp. HL-MZ7 TaxID=3400627 RepID=UPI003CF773F1
MTTNKKNGGFLEQAGLFFSVLFYVLFSWHFWWSGVAPRLIRGSAEREAIHHAHLSIGATLFVFLIFCFLIWLFKPGGSVVTKLKSAFSDGKSTAISLFFIMMFFSMLNGLAQAWAKDEETAFLGVFNLPHFVDWSWGTAGYMHSSFSTLSAALFSGIVFVYLFSHLKKYVSPGIAVALLIVLHLLINLPKPPSIHPIAAFGTYVLTPMYYFIALAIYSLANNRKFVYWPIYAVFFVLFMYLPYFAFKVLPPWHQTAAGETVLVESKTALIPARTKSEIFPDEASLAEAKKTASWCTQCHNATASETHLLGPNLVNVYNRQAGTVKGYGRYSKAMIDAGLRGTFWTRENLSEFLLHGQDLIPGNLMNQQTDLSDPARREKVIDFLEYISATEQD